MAPKLRKHQAGTAVTAPAAPASPAAPTAAASAKLMEVSATIDHLLSLPDSSLLEGTGIADVCKILTQLFAQQSSARPADHKQLAIKALHQLKLPHLVAKLLSSSSTQPDGQLSSSKWQQPDYCRSVTKLLESHGLVFKVVDLAVKPAGQQQDNDVMQAGLLLLQSGVLQQVTLAQQQLAELLEQQQQQQQGDQQLQPPLATQLSAGLLYYMITYCRCVGLLMAPYCSQPGVAAALHAAIRAAARLSALVLQHTISGKVKWEKEVVVLGALDSAYEVFIFAGYIQRLTDNSSSSSSSSSSSGGGGGGASSTPCSADSGACKDRSILADTAVLRLQFMLLAVYTRAICQEAPSSKEHSSSQQFPPQQVDPTAATDSSPTQPRSLLQLSEELWAVYWPHNPQQQQVQQQQQPLACLQLLTDTLQSELCLKHFGPPAERLQLLVERAAVGLDAANHALEQQPQLPSTADKQHLGSSSSKGGGADGSSSSSSEYQELQQLLQQSSWVLLPLFLAIGAKCTDQEVAWICLVLRAVCTSMVAWERTAANHWVCSYNGVLAACKQKTDAQAAAGGSVSGVGAAAAAAAAAASAVEGVAATAVAAAAAGSEAEEAAAALAAAEAKLFLLSQDIYRWVNGLLYYWVMMTDKQVTDLAAAVAAAAAAGSRGGSTSSSTISSSVVSHSEALYELLKLAVPFDTLYALADVPHLRTRLPTLNPWQEHSVAVVVLLERLIRTVLAPAISSSSSLGASAEQELLAIRQHTEMALSKLITCRKGVASTPLTLGAACCAFQGVELRRHLFGLALSHFKLSGLQGCSADCVSIEALMRYVVDIGCFLVAKLQQDYTLAAVRAAVAPWLVLVGRLHRLLADLLREKIAAATALLAQGSASNEGAAEELLSAVAILVEVATVSFLWVQKEMLGCFTHSEAEQYKGTRQYPDPDAVGDHYGHHYHQQHSHSSGSVPVHHLQHPGLAVEKVVSIPAAAAADTVAGGSAGTVGAAASSSSSSATAVECVLLDDLDSWADSEVYNGLYHKAVAAQNTMFLQYSVYNQKAGAPVQEDLTALQKLLLLEARSRARKPPLEVWQSVFDVLQPLPELLHAAGTALCNLLPVPWCCNNPSCSNMGCVVLTCRTVCWLAPVSAVVKHNCCHSATAAVCT